MSTLHVLVVPMSTREVTVLSKDIGRLIGRLIVTDGACD